MVTAQPAKGTIAVAGFGLLEAAQPLRERVYDALEETIVDGVFAPGEHLKEDDLARRLGVSRNPVREALQRLVHDGLVDHRPGKGVFVHSPTLKEVGEVFHARALLESDCARLAADRISPADLARLEGLLSLGRAATEAKDASRLLELNEQFHTTVVSAADNSVMAKMMVSLQRRIRWYFSRVVVIRAAGSWDQHNEVFEALRDHDGDRAARCMAAHVAQTGQTIRDSLSAGAGSGPASGSAGG